MNRQQLKARAARDIFLRMRESNETGNPILGSYFDAMQPQVDGLELILLKDVERVGSEGFLVVDQVQISALAEHLPKVRRDGIFTTACGKRWRVSDAVRNDGVIVTAAVTPG